jgi:HEAT repeat protein
VAAAQILGELRLEDPSVCRALVECLDRGEAFMNRFALEALAKIGTPKAVQALVERLGQGGGDLDMVTHLLRGLGAPAHKALADSFGEASRDIQLRIVSILGREMSRESLGVLQNALLAPNLAREAGEALIRHADALTPAQRKSVKEGCNRLLGRKNLEVPPECLAEGLLVLGRMDESGARTTLLRFCTDKNPTVVRRAALRALAGVKLTPAQVQSLLTTLVDNTARALEEPTMAVLEEVGSWEADTLPVLKKLLRSKRPDVALFALRALRSSHTPEVAKETLRFLTHASREFRGAAAMALGENPAAVELLLRALQTERDPERAKVISEILAHHRDHFPAQQLKGLVEKVCRQLSVQEPMGEVHLRLLLEIDGPKAEEMMVEKAVRLRRARRLEECLTILAHLARSSHLPAEGRYQMAVARLLLDENGSRGENTQAGDATMGYIAGLVRDGFPVLDRLKKEAMVPPKAKLRVGSHFAEAVGAERRFGSDLLHHVADKHGRDRVGEEARLMLRAEGL